MRASNAELLALVAHGVTDSAALADALDRAGVLAPLGGRAAALRACGLTDALDAIAVARENAARPRRAPALEPDRIRTGLADLDVLTRGGFKRGELAVLSGWRGSTAPEDLMLHFVRVAALDAGRTTLMLSSRTPTSELATLLLSSVGRIDGRGLRAGGLTEDEQTRLDGARAALERAPLFLARAERLDAASVRAEVAGIALRKGAKIELVVLEDFAANAAPVELRAIARELDVAVLVLTDLEPGAPLEETAELVLGAGGSGEPGARGCGVAGVSVRKPGAGWLSLAYDRTIGSFECKRSSLDELEEGEPGA